MVIRRKLKMSVNREEGLEGSRPVVTEGLKGGSVPFCEVEPPSDFSNMFFKSSLESLGTSRRFSVSPPQKKILTTGLEGTYSLEN